MSCTTALVVPAASLKNCSAAEQLEDLRRLLRRDGQARARDAAAHLDRAREHLTLPRFAGWLAGDEELLQAVAELLAIGAAHPAGHLIEQVRRRRRRRRQPDPEHRDRGGKVERAELIDQPLSLDPVDRGVPEAVKPLHRPRG